MGIKDWTKKIFPSDYDVDEDYDEEYIEEEEPVREERREAKPTVQAPNYTPAPAPGAVKLAHHTGSSIEMKVVTPTRFDAVTQIADMLLDNKTVLLNLENTNKETAKRLIDFLSGVAYALNGDVQKVADNTFAVTPNNVAVSNESVDAAAEETSLEQ